MDKKFILVLIIFCILGGVLWTESIIRKQTQSPEPEQTEGDLPLDEEIPQKGFQELKVTYYGDDAQYRMDTVMEEMLQKTDGDVTFQQLQARLFDGDELVQEFVTPEGWMFQQDGIVQLKGPIRLASKEVQVSMNEMALDLNAGTFQSTGQVVIQSEKIKMEADTMNADFDLNQIHLTGRPRLTVKKGG